MGLKKKLVALAAAVALFIVPSVVSAAVDKYRYDNSQAWAYWTQIDPVNADGIVGWHFGYINAYQFDSEGEGGIYVDAWIEDAFCPEGVEPYSGGGHGEEPVDDPCTYGFRYGYSENATLEITGRKLDSARMTGTLILSDGHGGDPVGMPPFDITLTGVGNTWTSQSMYRDRYQGGMGMSRDRWTQREATVTGFIGPMGFAPDLSGGGFGVSSGFSLWKG
ncbi:MAG: hypothetical protein OEX04_01045 [Acidimicrobiia bacterium]|nr:hypothetical protein [Acidimicrobiia bacterium]MDH4306040.1 hypothetical protein [Acidimicrobiia bacterium]MDH5294280.1 hypothetical protein [Acidimicrobiia bacterium]